MTDMCLIGLVGHAGAGKDTVAEYMVEKFGFKQISFAEKLKQVISDVFDVPLHHFNDRHLKNAIHPNLHCNKIEEKFGTRDVFAMYLAPVLADIYGKTVAEIMTLRWHMTASGFFYSLLPDHGCSPRRAAQLIGSEGFREQICVSTWIDYALKVSKGFRENGIPVVISDVRFPNEMDSIRKHGGTILAIDRELVERHDHSSESHIAGMIEQSDVVILNNDTIKRLHSKITDVLQGVIQDEQYLDNLIYG